MSPPAMDPDFERRRDEIAEESLDVPTADLPAFLDSRCGSDTKLRQEVQRILDAAQRMGDGFLETAAAAWVNPRFEPGQQLGRYRIEAVIGTGGMGVVYRGRDTGIGRLVAIKVLAPQGGPGQAGDERFLAEIRLLGSIRHPNVVQIYDFGEIYGVPYLVMEHLSGEDLSQRLRAAPPLEPKAKLEIARQLGTALEHVHSIGILHRDVKPGNVFVESSGAIKLMDFGIARFDELNKQKTTALVGTLEYVAPEQVRGASATQQSDIYSYAIVLFELFTGRRPYEGNTAEVLYKIVHSDLPVDWLRQASLPKQLIRLIEAMAEKDPSKRPRSMTQVLEELSAVNMDATQPAGTRDWRKIAAAVGGLAAAGAVVLYTLQRPQPVTPAIERPAITEPAKSQPAEVRTPPPQEIAHEPLSKKAEPEPRRQETADIETRRIELPKSERAAPSPSLPAAPVLTESPRDTAPPVLNGVTIAPPPPAPRSAAASAVNPDPPRPNYRADILRTLGGYMAAFRAKDIARITALWPSMPAADQRKLESSFRFAKAMDLQLSMDGEPVIDRAADGSLLATVRCKRLLRMTPITGRPPEPRQDACILKLESRGGEWKIIGQQQL